MNILLKNISMYLRGYEKIPLNDVKGVLTKNNNFKWVKYADRCRFTEYTSGTKVKDAYCANGEQSKTITRTDGTIYSKLTSADGSWKIIKAFIWKNGTKIVKVFSNE